MGNTDTHIANATSNNIQIFYKKSELKLHDITVAIGGEVFVGTTGTQVKATGESRLNFTRSEGVCTQVIPARDYIDCPAFETMYVTGYAGENLLFANYKAINPIGQPKSFIITSNGSIKYAKSHETWVDDQGIDHKPKATCDAEVFANITPTTVEKGVQISNI